MDDLLSKFDAVSIGVDSRISGQDRQFCEQNQAAYEAAVLAYQEFSYFWSDMEKTQDEYQKGIDNKYSHNYLHSDQGPKISKSLIRDHIHALHTDFICAIITYFRGQYKITIHDEQIVHALVPVEPKVYLGGDNREHDVYLQKMQDIRIRYQDIIDQIMLRLDGRGLTEQAFYELCQKCKEAAYLANEKHEARFEQKKDLLRLKENFCTWRDWPYTDWVITDKAKDLIKGIAHFETGTFDAYPAGFDRMLGWQGIKTDVLEFPGCIKLKKVKLFKNGRIDVRFTSMAYAVEFVSTYLAAV